MKVVEFVKNFTKKHLAWTMLILASIVFSILNPAFLSLRNWINILNQNAYVLLAAYGICFIQMSGNLDMGIGFAVSIACLIGAYMLRAGLPVILCVLTVLVLGILLSLFTTVWSIVLRIPRMFVSFATSSIFQGAAFLISKGKTISGLPDSFKAFGQGTIPGTNASWALLVVLFFGIIVSYVLNKTYFGRYVFAIGGNKEAARLAGINVDKMNIIIGIVGGFFLGLSGLCLIARVGSATASSAVGLESMVITGLLVGGVSIRGGEGKLNGCIAGIMLIALLTNGMQIAGLNVYWQYILRGCIMLLTVYFDIRNYALETAALNEKKNEDVKAAVAKA